MILRNLNLGEVRRKMLSESQQGRVTHTSHTLCSPFSVVLHGASFSSSPPLSRRITQSRRIVSCFSEKMTSKSAPFKLILGSSSVARRSILAEMGYEFSIKILMKRVSGKRSLKSLLWLLLRQWCIFFTFT